MKRFPALRTWFSGELEFIAAACGSLVCVFRAAVIEENQRRKPEHSAGKVITMKIVLAARNIKL